MSDRHDVKIEYVNGRFKNIMLDDYQLRHVTSVTTYCKAGDLLRVVIELIPQTVDVSGMPNKKDKGLELV